MHFRPALPLWLEASRMAFYLARLLYKALTARDDRSGLPDGVRAYRRYSPYSQQLYRRATSYQTARRKLSIILQFCKCLI